MQKFFLGSVPGVPLTQGDHLIKLSVIFKYLRTNKLGYLKANLIKNWLQVSGSPVRNLFTMNSVIFHAVKSNRFVSNDLAFAQCVNCS